MKLSTKLLLAFLLVGMIPLLLIGWLSLNRSSEALSEQTYNQLEAIREIKKGQLDNYFKERQTNLSLLQETVGVWRAEAGEKLAGLRESRRQEVERYFGTIENQVLTLSKNPAVVSAMEALPAAFAAFPAERGSGSGDERLLRRYYEQAFGETYREATGQAAQTETLLGGLGETERALQATFMARNRHPLGSKHLLDASEAGTQYDQIHQEIHPVMRHYMERFGYYDLFLVEPEDGHIVYSVFKEIDFATSLKRGPYAESGIGEVFARANELQDGDAAVLVDYRRYTPSYEAPASFIASPIFQEGEKVGILIFQMPIDRLNEILLARAGLGETGETYLVGPDHLMRSDSYLDPENRSVMASFAEPRKGSVETKPVEEALAGRSGFGIHHDYRGEYVLSAYAPVNVLGLRWAILAEIDLAEALNPTAEGGQEYYADFVEKNGYYDLFLIDPAGYCFYSVARESDYQTNLQTGPYADSGLGELINRVLREKRGGMEDFAPYAPSGGEAAAFLAEPVLVEGDLELVVAVQYSPEALNAMMAERAGMGETGETYLVGPDFRMRSDSFLDSEGRSIQASFAGTVEANGVRTEASQAALQGETGSGEIMDYNGNPVLSAYTPVQFGNIDWALLAEIDRKEAFAAITQLRVAMIGVALLVGLVVVVVALWIARSIARPIMEMVNRITHASAETSSASSQVSTSSQSLAEGASEQASSLEETSSSLEEISSLISSGVERAQSTNEVAGRARTSAENGQQSMREMRGRVDTVNRSVEELQTAMDSIKESSGAISKIIKTIDEIAFQTNILALNAAVEAARAGEAGAGFAVVADEVRSLASRAAEAAGETNRMIGDSVTRSERGADVTMEVARHLKEVLEKAEDVDAGLQSIVKEVSEVSTAMDGLESGSREQSNGIEQINTGVTQINEVTQSTAASAEEAASASEELNAQAESLQEIVDALTALVAGSRAHQAGTAMLESHQNAPQTNPRKLAATSA